MAYLNEDLLLMQVAGGVGVGNAVKSSVGYIMIHKAKK